MNLLSQGPLEDAGRLAPLTTSVSDVLVRDIDTVAAGRPLVAQN